MRQTSTVGHDISKTDLDHADNITIQHETSAVGLQIDASKRELMSADGVAVGHDMSKADLDYADHVTIPYETSAIGLQIDASKSKVMSAHFSTPERRLKRCRARHSKEKKGVSATRDLPISITMSAQKGAPSATFNEVFAHEVQYHLGSSSSNIVIWLQNLAGAVSDLHKVHVFD